MATSVLDLSSAVRPLFLAALFAACATAPPVVQAQTYPVKPVRVLLPFGTGGTDLVARWLALKLSPILGQPVVTEPRAKLEELIRHRRERERQIVALLEKGPSTVEQLAAALYADVRAGVQHLARNQIKSHLIKLEKEGRVVAGGDTYRLK